MMPSKLIASGNFKNDTLNKNEFLINSSFISAAAITYTGLYQLWYKNYPQTSFQFFDDLHEWKFMDKAGHICTAYHLNKAGYNLLKHYRIEKPLFKSSVYSFTYMTGIEVFDGFSKNWGFSWYDIISNGIGTFLFASQEHYLKKQLVKVKFSSHMTELAGYRPNLLGKNKIERILKDYNGQTYWLTFDFNNKIQERVKVFKYLNFSLGYSIDGFVGARNNNILNCSKCNEITRQSQLLFSIDLDLSEIKTKNRLLELILNSFSVIKFPAPTLILQGENEFRWFYF